MRILSVILLRFIIKFDVSYENPAQLEVISNIYRPDIPDFEVTLELDSRQKTTKRLFLAESRETTYTTHILLSRRQEECKDVTVYLDVSDVGLLYQNSLVFVEANYF